MLDRIKIWFGQNYQGTAAGDVSLGEQLILFLASQISVPETAVSVQEKVAQFQTLSPAAQSDALPATYLLLEQYLAEVDPQSKFTRPQLRQMVRSDYAPLLDSEPFSLIFIDDEEMQELLLCRDFIASYLNQAYPWLTVQLDEVIIWLALIPEQATLPIPLHKQTELPDTNRGWIKFLRQYSQSCYLLLEKELGRETAVRILEKSYDQLAQFYMGLETFPSVIALLPEHLLDEQKINLLSARQMQRALLKNVEELQQINDILSRKNSQLERIQSALLAAREEALRSSAQFQAVVNTVGDGIIAFTNLGDIILANSEAQTMWQQKTDELLGEHICTLLPNLYLNHWDDTRQNGSLQKSGYDVTRILGQWVQMESERANGQTFPVEIKINVAQIGERMVYTTAVRDITNRKRFERTMALARDWALEASDLKSRLLANVGHDLRTPLNAMLGYADMLNEGVYGTLEEEQLAVVDRIIRNGAQMNGLLNNLLDQVRAESGRLNLNIRPFEPATLLENVQSTITLPIRRKGLTSETYLDANLPQTMLGDEERLFQIILNLVNNAIKFTNEGFVKIQFCLDDPHHWSISVQDSGCGISKNDQALIFEPFQQIIGTGKEAEGLGLGLSIVKQFVTLMEGTITLTSQIDQGTIVKIQLPITVQEK